MLLTVVVLIILAGLGGSAYLMWETDPLLAWGLAGLTVVVFFMALSDWLSTFDNEGR